MTKIWLVAKGEYLKRVAKRSFLLGTFLIPMLFAVIIGITIFIIEQDRNKNPFGYVDNSGLLNMTQLSEMKEDEEWVEIISYPDQNAAISALEKGEIQGFYVISEDFLNSRKVDLYYWDENPDSSVLIQFDNFIRASVLPEGPNIIEKRIIEGVNLTLQSADGKRQFDDEVGFVIILFPLAVAIFFIFSVMSASGYFLQAITDEKENRTMEIAITSLSPGQLISGKSLGLIGVALTQIFIWLISTAIAWWVAQKTFPEIQVVKLPWDILIVFLLFFIPSFALIGGMMAAIGGAVTELQEGQQIAGILNLLFTFPLFLSALAFANPDSPILIFMSFWPTTSFLTITLRWGLTIIPYWQIIISLLILIITGGITIWIAARIFRVGMLQYGQKLNIRAIMAAIHRSSADSN